MGKLGITLTVVATALAAATAVLASPTATAKEPPAIKESAWRLQTDDTALALAVRSNRLFITGLKQTGQPREWVPAPAEVPMADGKNWDGLQSHNPDLDRGSVFVFNPSDRVPESQHITLRGLLRDKPYRVEFQDAKQRSGTMTGAQLMDQGLTLTLKGKEASEIIWLNCPELSAAPQSL